MDDQKVKMIYNLERREYMVAFELEIFSPNNKFVKRAKIKKNHKVFTINMCPQHKVHGTLLHEIKTSFLNMYQRRRYLGLCSTYLVYD